MKTSFIQVDNEMVLFMVVEELGSITDITIVCLILSGRPNFKEPTETSNRIFVHRRRLLESLVTYTLAIIRAVQQLGDVITHMKYH